MYEETNNLEKALDCYSLAGGKAAWILRCVSHGDHGCQLNKKEHAVFCCLQSFQSGSTHYENGIRRRCIVSWDMKKVEQLEGCSR